MRSHAVRHLLISQFPDSVAGPAEFERADLLQILALEEQLEAGHLVECRRGQHRRADGEGFDSVSGFADRS